MVSVYNQFTFSHEHKPITVRAIATGAGSSAPVLKKWNTQNLTLVDAPSAGWRGIKSITRNGVGDYTFALQDSFLRFMNLHASVLALDGATTPLATQAYVKSVTPRSVRIVTYLTSPGTPADLGSNDQLYVAFNFEASGAP